MELRRKICLSLSLFAAVAISVVGTGCSSQIDDEATAEGNVDEEGEGDLGVTEEAIIDRTADGCAGLCRPNNCVDYARCRTRHDGGRVLPPTGSGMAGKLAVARDGVGRHGCVAMIRTSHSYGHAAYVEDTWVSGGIRRYRVSEADWAHASSCGQRSGSKAALNIAEFWCP